MYRITRLPDKLDLHMHTVVSDGTDAPEEIAARVRDAGIALFSVTDHDATAGCETVRNLLKEGDPAFIFGVEFSCRDEEGKYHILGYGYDPEAPSIRAVVEAGHELRLNKLKTRLDLLKSRFGFGFSEEDRAALFALNNPGKPHIGNLMVRYGYAATKEEAIRKYINECGHKEEHVRPEDAIRGILGAGGIPVLAHPSYGSGDELIIGEEMDRRLGRLIGFGLRGAEAFYSGFTPAMQEEILSLAKRYDLYVTAGSDYHGTNKLVRLGDTGFDARAGYPEGLRRFLSDVSVCTGSAPRQGAKL